MISFAVLAIAKATLACAAALLLSRLCRRTRASIRHLLFALAFAALVAIPGAGLVLPTVAVTVPAAATAPANRTVEMAEVLLSIAAAHPPGFGSASVSRETAPTRPVAIAQVVAAVWLIIFALFLLPVVVGLWQLRRLRNRAVPWANGPNAAIAAYRTIQVGSAPRVEGFLVKSTASPPVRAVTPQGLLPSDGVDVLRIGPANRTSGSSPGPWLAMSKLVSVNLLRAAPQRTG
jgi:hypothetical protein